MVHRILNIAVPNGVENDLFQLIKVALSSVTVLFGTAQIAAKGIAQSFWSLTAMIGVTAAMCCDWLVRAVVFLHRFRSGK